VGAAEYTRKWIAVFYAGFDDLSGKSLSNFDSFGDATAFGYQSGNIRARSYVAAVFEALHTNSDCHFLNFREVLVLSHQVPSFGHYTKACSFCATAKPFDSDARKSAH